MGVQLRDIIMTKDIGLEMLGGKTIAIDALNALYQFISTIRQEDGTPLMDSKGTITSHLSGMFYRTSNLMQAGITPVYVFDGKPIELKSETLRVRNETRENARQEWALAKEEGRIGDARKWAQASTKINSGMIADSKLLLEAMGVVSVQAPGEGEAQCARMCADGAVFASVSQDYDSLLFGAPTLVRNLSISGRRKIPGQNAYVKTSPEMIHLNEELVRLGISREQLIIIGVLSGTDFNPHGVKGIGAKKGLALVKKYGTLEKVLEHVDWDFEKSPKEIADIFLNPDVTASYSISNASLNEEGIYGLLCDEHDFSRERVEKVVGLIKAARKAGSQKDLSTFF